MTLTRGVITGRGVPGVGGCAANLLKMFPFTCHFSNEGVWRWNLITVVRHPAGWLFLMHPIVEERKETAVGNSPHATFGSNTRRTKTSPTAVFYNTKISTVASVVGPSVHALLHLLHKRTLFIYISIHVAANDRLARQRGRIPSRRVTRFRLFIQRKAWSFRHSHVPNSGSTSSPQRLKESFKWNTVIPAFRYQF